MLCVKGLGVLTASAGVGVSANRGREGIRLGGRGAWKLSVSIRFAVELSVK